MTQPPPERFHRHSAILVANQGLMLGLGYLVHLYVGRRLGPESYGAFGLMTTLVFWAETALYGGFLVAVPRAVAADPTVARPLWVRIASSVALAAGAVAALLTALAPPLSRVLGDPSLRPLFLPAFLDLVPFCVYNVTVGLLDGHRAFARRALCASAYMGAKVLFTVGFLHAGWGARGALLGNVAGSCVGLAFVVVMAWALTRHSPAPAPGSVSVATARVLRQALPAGTLALLLQVLLSMDLLVLGHLSRDRAAIGHYLGAVSLAKAPYFLLSAQAAVLLPLIGSALAEPGADGRSRAATVVQKELRLALLLLLPAVALGAATAGESLAFVLGEPYREAAAVLPPLIAGLTALALFRALATAAMAGGHNGPVVAMLVAAVGLEALGCALLVPRFGMGGAASSSLVASGLALLAVLAWLRGLFQVRFPWGSLSRVLLASAAGGAVAAVTALTSLPVPVAWLAGAAAIAALLVVTGELPWRVGRRDLAR